MSECKVVITDYVFKTIEYEQRIISAAGGKLVAQNCKTDAEVIALAKDADIILVQYYEITARIIEALENCKLILRYGIGVNNVDIEAASKKGILVANVPDYAIEEVSDHTFMLILSLIRKMPVVTQAIKDGIWDVNIACPVQRVKGQTLGLVGYGRIPRLLNKKIKGFGFRVLAYDPYVSVDDVCEDCVTLVDFETLLEESDIISLHAPLSKSTKHLFHKETFSRMKETAYLVNTSRGGLIEEQDLIEAIENGVIAGAALDVVEDEPLSPDSRLRQCDRIIVTPHMAWYSEKAQEMLQITTAEYAAMYMRGDIPPSVLNRNRI